MTAQSTITAFDRDLVWLKNRAVTKLSLPQIAKDDAYRTKNGTPPTATYLSRRIRKLALRIAQGVEEVGMRQTAAYYGLTDRELHAILYYAHTITSSKGGDLHE